MVQHLPHNLRSTILEIGYAPKNADFIDEHDDYTVYMFQNGKLKRNRDPVVFLCFDKPMFWNPEQNRSSERIPSGKSTWAAGWSSVWISILRVDSPSDRFLVQRTVQVSDPNLVSAEIKSSNAHCLGTYAGLSNSWPWALFLILSIPDTAVLSIWAC